MTDYTKATGSTGTMMIRVLPTTVEFWIKAGPATFAYQMPWASIIAGVTSSWKEFRFESGGDWQKVTTLTVLTTKSITFKLGSTGTSGLGGPTNLTVNVVRASPPAAPSTPVLSSLTNVSVVVTFTDGANNGDAIDSRQIGYGTSSAAPTSFSASDGSTTISGLTPGTTYYFWARTHNSEGYGPWSARATTKTKNVPSAPSVISFSNKTPTTVDCTFTQNANNGATVDLLQIGYGTSPTTPSTIVTSDGSTTITGLTPGTTYYFFARAHNTYGNSAWSGPAVLASSAGAFVKVAGVWRPAIPYVRVSGVWQVAKPWGKVLGVWRESV